MAIGLVVLQTVSMAIPANAGTLNEQSIQVQTMTATDVRQEPIEFDNYIQSWIVYPVDAGFETMSSDFGYRAKACNACSTNHQGIDFLMPRGSTIRSVFYGTVIEVSQYRGGLGTTVTIRHPELGGIETVYSHMIYGSPTVKVGETVKPGQKIGKVGMTGVTTAYHLHFEVRIDGYAIDPEKWLKSNKAKKFKKK
jgi:murein DD-endopeptidase MepM/ murein hydrolase activator NlpD